MKLVVAGSRDFDNRTLMFDELDDIIDKYNITEIISGGAKGADFLGEEYAKETNINLTIMPAEWSVYGKRAGHKRNIQMLEYTDIVIAFWDGVSRGTKHMIQETRKSRKVLIVINYNEEDDW